MCPTFSFSVVDVDDVHIVSLRGELDMATVVGLEDWLVEVSGSTVVIDLDQLTFMDSSGIAALIGARNRIIEKGDRLVLTRPHENVRRVLEITGLTEWLSDWDPNWLAPDAGC
jgi:anti-sigma B factor antagonist